MGNKHEGAEGGGVGQVRIWDEWKTTCENGKSGQVSCFYIGTCSLWLHLFMSGQTQTANKCGYYEKRVHLSLSVLQWFSAPTPSYMSPYILPRADGNNDSIFIRTLAKASTLAHASARKWVRPPSSLLLPFIIPCVLGLSLCRCASFHQSQMEVRKKVSSELMKLNFTVNLVQFVSFTTEHFKKKTEGTKTITPLLHFITCIQMDRDFLFYTQTIFSEWKCGV